MTRSACSAPALLIACKNRNDSGRLQADFIEASDELFERRTREHRDLANLFGCGDCGLRGDGGSAVGEGRRLGDFGRFGDANGQAALRHGDRRDLHVRANDDCPGAFVDDDARGRFHRHAQIADLGEKARRVRSLWQAQQDASVVAFLRQGGLVARARVSIDGVGDAHRGRVIWIAQLENKRVVDRGGRARGLALDRGAVGNAADRRDAMGERFILPLRREAGNGDRTLRDGVDGRRLFR